MQVLEELLFKLHAAGGTEAAAEVDTVSGAIHKSGTTAEQADAKHVALGKSFGGLKSMASSAAGMVGIAGLAFGLDKAVKSAQQFQDTQAQLGTSIKANVHAPAKGAAEQMGNFADSMSEQGGFMPIQAMQGMTQFLRVTQSVSKSEGDLTLASNIARGAHVDLGRAVRAVTMLEQGRTTGLSKLGISITPIKTAEDALTASGVKATVAQKEHAKAVDALATKQAGMAQVTKQYTGAMATYSRTSAGGTTNLANSMEVLGQKVGQMLLPIISTFVGVLQRIVPLLSGLLNILKPMLPVVIGLAIAWGAYKAVMVIVEATTFIMQGTLTALTLAAQLSTAGTEGLTLAWGSLDAAMQANVIGLVVIALVALVMGIIEAYKHVAIFRNVVNAAWSFIRGATVDTFNAVKGAILDVFTWVKGHWMELAPILLGPFAPLAEVIVQVITHFQTLKSVATTVVDWVGQEFGKLLHLVESLPGKIAHVATNLWGGLKHGLVDVLNWVIDKFNAVPFIHGEHLGPVHIPGIPKIAHISAKQMGGPITSTGPYLVGERGPELVTLPQGSYVTPNQGIGAGGGNQTIVIYNMLDGKPMSKSVIRQGLLQQSRGG